MSDMNVNAAHRTHRGPAPQAAEAQAGPPTEVQAKILPDAAQANGRGRFQALAQSNEALVVPPAPMEAVLVTGEIEAKKVLEAELVPGEMKSEIVAPPPPTPAVTVPDTKPLPTQEVKPTPPPTTQPAPTPPQGGGPVTPTPTKPTPNKPKPNKPKPSGNLKPKPGTKVTPKPKPKTEPAEGRTFKTQGDPIIRTGDGLEYSINKPGKYVSLKSQSGDFLMEQQVSITKDRRHYNTAIGFKVGNDRIVFDAAGGDKPATMKINGQSVTLGNKAFTRDLPGGGKLSYDPMKNKVTFTTPQGDDVTVHRAWNAQKVHYLNVEVTMSAKRPAGSVYGVLGTMDADTNAKNDARMRDGSVYNGTIGNIWKTPEAFIDEWRSKRGESIL